MLSHVTQNTHNQNMSQQYCDDIINMLEPWAQVTAKRMFGGWGLYRERQIFAIIADDRLYFKVDEHNRPDYEAAGSQPFTYNAKGKRAVMSYWLVPAHVLTMASSWPPGIKRHMKRECAQLLKNDQNVFERSHFLPNMFVAKK